MRMKSPASSSWFVAGSVAVVLAAGLRFAPAQTSPPTREQQLLEALRSGAGEKRDAALGAAASYPTPEIRKALVGLLSDASSATRTDAREALGRFGDLDVVGDVVKLLSSASPDARAAAAELLGELGAAEAVEPLIRALSAEEGAGNSFVRCMAARALGELGDERATEALLAAIESQGDGTLAEHCWYALGQIADAKAVDALKAAVRAGGSARFAAMEQLFRLGRTSTFDARQLAVASLKDPSPAIRKTALACLEHHLSACPSLPLREMLRDADDDVRQNALYVLAMVELDAALPHLAEMLADPARRGHAAQVIGWLTCVRDAASAHAPRLGVPGEVLRSRLAGLADRRLVDALIGATGDAEFGREAIFTLGRIGGEQAVEALLPLAGGESPSDAAIQALGAARAARAVETLRSIVASQAGDYLRGEAVRALGEIGDPAAAAEVVAFLQTTQRDVRAAADALGRMGNPAAVEPLLARMEGKDLDARDRAAVAEALGRLGDKRAFEALLAAAEGKLAAPDDSPRRARVLRAVAAEALGRLGDERAIEPLTRLLADPEAPPEVRLGAARGLGTAKPPAAPPALLSALADAFEEVRAAAAEAIGHIGDRNVTGELMRLLGAEPARGRAGAALALGQLQVPEAVDALADRLRGDPSVLVRRAAAEALGRLGGPSALAALREAATPAGGRQCARVRQAAYAALNASR